MKVEGDIYGDGMGRNKPASERLRFQVFLWKTRFGWSIPPSVPLRANPGWEVADIACGSGDWIMDMASEFQHANFTGFDISGDQFPDPESLPSNVRFSPGFDIYKPCPPEYYEKFDVIHMRLVFMAIRDNNVHPILENFMKMLKPGGYLVWGDLNIKNFFKVNYHDYDAPEKRIDLPETLLTQEHWLDTLDQTFGFHGLDNVTTHSQRIKQQWVKPWCHLIAWGGKEHMMKLRETHGPDDEIVKMKMGHYAAHAEDARKGLLTIYNPTIVVGQKPQTYVVVDGLHYT